MKIFKKSQKSQKFSKILWGIIFEYFGLGNTRVPLLSRNSLFFVKSWAIFGSGPMGPKRENFQKITKSRKIIENFVGDHFRVFWVGEHMGTLDSSKFTVFVEIWALVGSVEWDKKR